MSYVVFDVETTYGESYKRKGNSFDPSYEVLFLNYSGSGVEYDFLGLLNKLKEVKILVGHNIKFDMLWFMRYHYEEVVQWLIQGGRIYDTAYAEYKLTGHAHKYPKLDEVAPKYGGSLKDPRIKLMLEAGKKWDELPKDMADAYVKRDVINTELIYLGQQEYLKKHSKFKTILTIDMEYLLYTTFCEYFGICVDKEKGIKTREEALKEQEILSNEILNYFKDKIPKNALNHINLSSAAHLSALLYGGDIKYKTREPTLNRDGSHRLRLGVPSYGDRDKLVKVTGLGIEPGEDCETKTQGVYKVGKEALKPYLHIPIVKTIARYKKINKIISAYVSAQGGSVLALVYQDGRIHGSLNHVGTVTGRLNSSAPNLQNIEKESPLKELFISRFEEGWIIQADWSQLEICVNAMLTGDINLQREINEGLDFHCKRLAFAKKMSYDEVIKLCKIDKIPKWVDLRDKAKAFSYQRAYGSSNESIAKKNDIPLTEVIAFAKAEEALYPSIKHHNDIVKLKIIESQKNTNTLAQNGMPRKVGFYTTPLGDKLTFYQDVYPYDKKRSNCTKEQWDVQKPYFKNPQIKNYKVQGTAARIQATRGAILIRMLLPHFDKIVPINDIHDAAMLDCKEEHLDLAKKLLLLSAKKTNEVLRKIFKLVYAFNYKVDIKYGKNWKECS